MSERIGVMVCGHGSRSKSAVGEFARAAEGLKAHFPEWPVEYGYLEFANPVIRDGLDKLREQGCTPPATPRTTSRRSLTPIRRNMASASTTAANSQSMPR
jgi:hypothetical protein